MHGLGKHIYELSDDDITFTLQVSITERLQSRLHWALRPGEKVLKTILGFSIRLPDKTRMIGRLWSMCFQADIIRLWNELTRLQMFWASLWIYNLALTVTKVSILVQYIRIFPIRRFRGACYAMLCIVIACGAWGIFGNVFICYPINLFWDESLSGRQCMNEYIIWFTTAGLNIGQDVIILFLPLPVIRSLQISKSQKKGLITMLALGARYVPCRFLRQTSSSQRQCHCDLNYSVVQSRQPRKLQRSHIRQFRSGHSLSCRGQRRDHLCLPPGDAPALCTGNAEVLLHGPRIHHRPSCRP
jgi:hypothetical protein